MNDLVISPSSAVPSDVEEARLAAVRACGLDPAGADPVLDDIAAVTALALGAPVALVSVIEEHHQWFAARVGVTERSTTRELSFCAWTIQTPDGPFVIPDTTRDPRFADNALVTGPPGVRFYAGLPVHDPAGHRLGALCVIDTVPRAGLSDTEVDVLTRMTRQVERHLMLRHHARDLQMLSIELRRREHDLEAAQRLGGMGSWRHELDGRPSPTSWSRGMYALLAHDPVTTAPSLDAWNGRFSEDDQRDLAEVLDQCRTTGQPFSTEVRIRRPDGTVLDVVVQGEADCEQDVTVAIRGIVLDVTERRRTERSLRHLADHDPLTGLPNRAVLTRELTAALSGDGWRHTGVCFIDLDDFKAINDARGHVAGDRLLQAVAGRLRAAVKHRDVVVRYGGDEFVVVCTGVDPAEFSDVVARLTSTLQRPVRDGDDVVPVAASLGSVHAGSSGVRTADVLLATADLRMYAVKRT